MHLRTHKILTVAIIIAACGRPAFGQSRPAEQLTCGDSTMPQAVYARATHITRMDTRSDIAIVVEDSSHRRVRVAEVQAWGPTGAVFQHGDTSGTTVFTERDPGLYSVRVRLVENGPRWIYAATLRPSFADTIIVTIGARCTLIWKGG